MPLLRQQEGTFDHVDVRLPLPDDHFDDVEAEVDLGPIEQPQPCACAAREEFLFLAIDGVGGASEFAPHPRFHLGEDERVFREVAADEIDFAAALRAEIATENFASVPAQEFFREPFAARAEAVPRIRARIPPDGREEKTGDGSDKAHVF